ncbi:MAG: branched-chain amino acid ABC transporter permease [Acidimicrobiales bacterium]
MSEFVAVVIASLILGAALGLMALSFTVTFAVSRVFNFAVGQFMVLAGLLVSAIQLTHSPVLNAVLAVVMLVGFGALTYLGTIRWPESHGAVPLTLVIITFGVGEIVEQAANLGWGGITWSAPLILHGRFYVAGAGVSYEGLLFLGVTAALVAALWAIQRYTIVGKQILAVGVSREAAKYYGINDRRVVTTAWAVGFGLLGVVGVLYLPLSGVSMSTGLTYGLQGFVAAVLGGLGNAPGALLGGLLIAFMINSIGVYVGTNVVDLVTYALLFAFLVLRPAGLTGLAGDLIGPRA